jgi:CP family cyanate transporter-like MFS transporter
LAYIVFGWLVLVLRDRGLDGVEAGLVLSVSVAAQAIGSLTAPFLATRGRDQRIANVAAVVLGLVGLMGCAYAPMGSVWIWSVILGLAQGALVALALTLIVLRSPDAFIAAHLSGMCQSVGYIIASAGPFLVGILHARTGTWNAAMLFSAAISAVMLPCAWGAGRDLTVQTARKPANTPVPP